MLKSSERWSCSGSFWRFWKIRIALLKHVLSHPEGVVGAVRYKGKIPAGRHKKLLTVICEIWNKIIFPKPVMVNFMCQSVWAVRYSDIYSNFLFVCLFVPMRVFLDEVNIWTNRPVKLIALPNEAGLIKSTEEMNRTKRWSNRELLLPDCIAGHWVLQPSDSDWTIHLSGSEAYQLQTLECKRLTSLVLRPAELEWTTPWVLLSL